MFLQRFVQIFAVLAAVELAILVWLAIETSLLTTFLIVVGTGLAGVAIARWQGLRAWNAIRSEVDAGKTPAAGLIDAGLIFVAGLFLLAPGLLTDVAGLLLLIPPFRRALRPRLTGYVRQKVERRVRTYEARSGGAAGEGEIIDVEFRRADAPQIEDRS